MKFLTEDQGREFVAAANLPVPEDASDGSGYYHSNSYKIPADAGRKTALARRLTAWVDDGAQEVGLLWITGYGIWPSSENQALFYLVRHAMSEKRSLRIVPCHCFDGSDLTAVECLVDLMLYFSWDGVFYAPGGEFIVRFSHDEILGVACRSPSMSIRTVEELRQLGMTVL
ncbi:MAG TPA: hypothetical protein VLK82_13375 [Candidatus Tectomicrobia bacterium]|nr:hypothetical protein [Candidatus Tectomicrobia bacterium]